MFKRIFQAEKGSVTVFAAITMTVLLGFASFAVDYGSLTNERSLLQNAADAAALAGVVVEDDAAAITAAKEYVLKNTTGVSAGEIQVTRPTSDTMKVSITKECPAFFSQILTGETTNQVAASATAKYAGKILAPGYAIWAEHEIEMKNKSEITGNIHSNDNNFDFKGTVTLNGNKTWDHEDMPDYSYLLIGAVPLDPAPYMQGNTIKITATVIASLDPDKIYYINDSHKVVISGPLNINLIADGNIEFNGSGASVDAKVLYSTGGDITLNGSGGVLNVLAYSPNGDITWNGSGSALNGAIIGQNFIENGSKGTVSYDESVVGEFAKLVPHLIQ